MTDMEPVKAPPFRLLLREFRIGPEWVMARARPKAQERAVVSDGSPVITVPGFCAGDTSMVEMRLNLRAAGFHARGWRMGANMGAKADTLERLHARISGIADKEGRAVHVVGWSLGGLYAREYAKRHPDMVASVVTMGTPFSGSRRANNAWRVYRIIAGHSVDAPPIEFLPEPKPPVPTYALWSPIDGVIAPQSARGDDSESDEAIEVDTGHFGFAYDASVVDVVIECMLRAEAKKRADEG